MDVASKADVLNVGRPRVEVRPHLFVVCLVKVRGAEPSPSHIVEELHSSSCLQLGNIRRNLLQARYQSQMEETGL